MLVRALAFFVPTFGAAAAGWYFAVDPFMGAVVGGFAGAILGVALNAFPNLNQSDDDERTDLPLIDP
jgi:hypothetical protein